VARVRLIGVYWHHPGLNNTPGVTAPWCRSTRHTVLRSHCSLPLAGLPTPTLRSTRPMAAGAWPFATLTFGSVPQHASMPSRRALEILRGWTPWATPGHY
jgi:hypothetical protein